MTAARHPGLLPKDLNLQTSPTNPPSHPWPASMTQVWGGKPVITKFCVLISVESCTLLYLGVSEGGLVRIVILRLLDKINVVLN